MSKYMFIGDIHGKKEIVEHVCTSFMDYHKVFVGDFLDSYDRSVGEQISALETAVLNARAHPNQYTILMGNHELSYLFPNQHMCSGYNSATQIAFRDIKKMYVEVVDLHKIIWPVDTEDPYILVTHAGVTGVDTPKQALSLAIDYEDDKFNSKNLAYNVGRFRGGYKDYGGILWCDYWQEHKGVPGLRQIVGHTAHRPEGVDPGIIYSKETQTFNIDCLDRVSEVLLYEDGKFKVKDLNTDRKRDIDYD